MKLAICNTDASRWYNAKANNPEKYKYHMISIYVEFKKKQNEQTKRDQKKNKKGNKLVVP